jgi:fructoselysine-6-P-deglycase FrlB-like protein
METLGKSFASAMVSTLSAVFTTTKEKEQHDKELVDICLKVSKAVWNQGDKMKDKVKRVCFLLTYQLGTDILYT